MITRRDKWWRLAVILAVCLAGAAWSQAANAQGGRRHTFIVTPRHGADIAAIAARHGGRVVRGFAEDGTWVLEIRTSNPEQTRQSLESDSLIFEAESDGGVGTPETPPDPSSQLNFSFDTPPPPPPDEDPNSQLNFAFDIGPDPMGYQNQYALQQVNLGNAHALATGRGVRVAILDTGVNPLHPDLVGHCVWGYTAIDPSQPPLDVPEPDEDGNIPPQPGVGHGTMIAGIVALVAPEAQIVPVKVLNAYGLGRESDVIEGIYWAIRHGVRVMNMSFSTSGRSKAFERAIWRARLAGIAMVASAGNGGNDEPRYPAALKSVLSVASVEADNTVSPWTSYGETVDLVCPGSGIRSTFWNCEYATWNGTSFAAAFATGAATLIRDVRPLSPVRQVYKFLTKTATSVDDVNPDYEGLLGSGLLNIENAVEKASGDAD